MWYNMSVAAFQLGLMKQSYLSRSSQAPAYFYRGQMSHVAVKGTYLEGQSNVGQGLGHAI